MGEFSIVFARSARKELESLNKDRILKIFNKILELEDNPYPTGCKKLSGSNNLWRLRVGDYRALYSIDNKQKIVDIISIRHRKEAYQ